MILQTGTKFDFIFQGLRKLFDPEGAKADELKERLKDPAFALRMAQATRAQHEIFSGTPVKPGPPDSSGIPTIGESGFRQQSPTERADSTAAFTQTRGGGGRAGRGKEETTRSPANPLAPLLASMGISPDNQGATDLLNANATVFLETLDEDVARLERRGGVAAEAETERRQVGRTAETAVTRGVQRETEEFQRIGGPEARAQTRKRADEQAIQLADFQLVMAGIETDVAEGALVDYNRFLKTNPELRGLAGISITNPVFARVLEGMANRTLREKLALMQLNKPATLKDQFEIAGSMLDIGAKLRQGVKDYNAAKEAGGRQEVTDAMLAALTAQTQQIHAAGLSHLYPDLIGADGSIVTIPSVRLGRGPGGRDPVDFEEAKQFGTEENIIDDTKPFLEAIALQEGEGREKVMEILFDNPNEETKMFIRIMQSRGEFDQFVKDIRRNSIEGRAERKADPFALIGGLR